MAYRMKDDFESAILISLLLQVRFACVGALCIGGGSPGVGAVVEVVAVGAEGVEVEVALVVLDAAVGGAAADLVGGEVGAGAGPCVGVGGVGWGVGGGGHV